MVHVLEVAWNDVRLISWQKMEIFLDVALSILLSHRTSASRLGYAAPSESPFPFLNPQVL